MKIHLVNEICRTNVTDDPASDFTAKVLYLPRTMLKICRLISKVSIQLIALLGNVTLAVVELLSELGLVKFKGWAIAGIGVGTSKLLGFGRPGRHTPGHHPSGRYRRCTIAAITQA